MARSEFLLLINIYFIFILERSLLVKSKNLRKTLALLLIVSLLGFLKFPVMADETPEKDLSSIVQSVKWMVYENDEDTTGRDIMGEETPTKYDETTAKNKLIIDLKFLADSGMTINKGDKLVIKLNSESSEKDLLLIDYATSLNKVLKDGEKVVASLDMDDRRSITFTFEENLADFNAHLELPLGIRSNTSSDYFKNHPMETNIPFTYNISINDKDLGKPVKYTYDRPPVQPAEKYANKTAGSYDQGKSELGKGQFLYNLIIGTEMSRENEFFIYDAPDINLKSTDYINIYNGENKQDFTEQLIKVGEKKNSYKEEPPEGTEVPEDKLMQVNVYHIYYLTKESEDPTKPREAEWEAKKVQIEKNGAMTESAEEALVPKNIILEKPAGEALTPEEEKLIEEAGGLNKVVGKGFKIHIKNFKGIGREKGGWLTVVYSNEIVNNSPDLDKDKFPIYHNSFAYYAQDKESSPDGTGPRIEKTPIEDGKSPAPKKRTGTVVPGVIGAQVSEYSTAVITKVSEEEKEGEPGIKQPIEGAKFTLYALGKNNERTVATNEDGVKLENLVTNAKGELCLEGDLEHPVKVKVVRGNYILKELSAPKQYDLTDGKDEHLISVGLANNNFQIENKLKPEWKKRYKAKHTFESATKGWSLPTEVTTLKPADIENLKNESSVSPTDPSKKTVKVTEGTWTFDGWEPKTAKINADDVTFVGKWSFVEANKYKIIHKFKAADGVTRELPPEVTAKLPKDVNDVYDETTARPTDLKESDKDVSVVEGNWHFDGWDASEKQIRGGNVTFTGTWSFVENPKYDVVHRFEPAQGAPALPESVKSKLPKDQKGVYKGVTVSPTDFTGKTVKELNGTWTFDGWKPANAVVGDSNVEFVGTWSFVEAPKHNVIYQFAAKGTTKELPVEINNYLPPAQNDVYEGTPITAADPTTKTHKVVEGTWNFDSWDLAPNTVMGKSDLTITGSWTFTEGTKYKATHTYVVEQAAGRTLPNEILNSKPNDIEGLYDGMTASAVDVAVKTVRVTEGTWTFKGWDQPTKVINGANVEFVGTWGFTEAPKYDVTHRYEPAEGSPSTLPQEVNATLPANITDVYEGSTVRPNSPTTESVKLYNGTWTFDGWTPTELVVNGPSEFVGKWHFTEADKYNVTYRFAVADGESRPLPAEIEKYKPENQQNVYNETVVNPQAPTATEHKVTEGKWTFLGWDKDSKQINGGDIEFLGKWSFTEANKYDVLYKFEAKAGETRALPPEIEGYKPATQKGVYDEVVVTPQDPTNNTHTLLEGTWTFDGWDAKSKKIEGANITFTGTWSFVEAPKHNITYKFIASGTDKPLPAEINQYLPENQTDVYEKTPIQAADPKQKTHKVTEGVWSFNSWDLPAGSVMGTADLVITGTWTFTEGEKYKAIHEFVAAATAGRALPQEVLQHKPENIEGFYDGMTATATKVAVQSVKVTEGTWTFAGWDKESKQINKGDVTFTGTWNFTEADKVNVTHRFVPAAGSPSTLPPEVEAALPDDIEDVYVETTVRPNPPKKQSVKLPNGTWTFDSWDEESKTVGKNTVFTGTWSFNKYKVKHVFEPAAGTDRQLPEVVTQKLPADIENVYDESMAHPTPITDVDVEVVEGFWHFNGWDEDEKQVNGGDVTFTGTWSFTEKPKHDVIHSFVPAAGSPELPDSIKGKLPPKKEGIYKGVRVTPDEITDKTVKEPNGTWTFNGWGPTEATVGDEDVTFTGTWSFTEAPKHKVVYRFVAKDTDKPLPEAINAYLPEEKTNVYEEADVTADAPKQNTHKVTEGVWTFDSWDKPTAKMGTEDLVITGSWTFTEGEKYKAVHEFVAAATAGRTLPPEVLQQKPANIEGLYDGVTVTAQAADVAVKTVKVTEGTWTFDGWDHDSKQVNKGDVTFTGTWSFTEAPKYTVTYNFKPDGNSPEIPEEIKKLTPPDKPDVYEGVVVTPDPIDKTTVKVRTGTWTFNGWDNPSLTVTDKNHSFTGTWTFTEGNKYNVSYEFTSNDGSPVPEQVMNLLPPAHTDLYEGDEITATEIPDGEVKVREGTWTFTGWDKDKITVTNKNEKFTGVWTFTEGEKKQVTYEFVGDDPNTVLPEEVMELLPKDNAYYYHGDLVAVMELKSGMVETYDAIYTFKEWDKLNVTISEDPAVFTGIWHKEMKPEYTITHEFISEDGSEIPEAIKRLLPPERKQYEGSKATPFKISGEYTHLTVIGGTWKFVGWDADEKLVDKDVKFVGTWKFVPEKPADKKTPDNKKKAPKTGDEENPLALLSLGILAGLAAAVSRRKARG